jgi:ABC-2 type transport system permease protein
VKAMWKRIGVLVRKEFYEVWRKRQRRYMLIVPPLLQLILFGYVATLDVEHNHIAWMDQDRTPASRELREAFDGSSYFEVIAAPGSEEEMRDLLDYGKVKAVIRVLPGFARDIERGEQTTVQILIDGTNSNTAAIVSNYAAQIVAGYSNRVLAEQQNKRMMSRAVVPVNQRLPVLSVRHRIWFNPSLKSRDFFVPTTIVQIITATTLMMTAMSIVREKEIGTMEQLMVTPLRPIELILGKTLPATLIGLLQLILVTILGLIVFRIPFRGSALLLLASAILFVLTTLGVGLYISTISSTQRQAAMASFFFFMPAFLLSGFGFPIRNMPAPVQYLTYLNPVRYFVEIVEGIFLKGTGVAILWPKMLALLLFGTIVLWASALRFRKRLD